MSVSSNIKDEIMIIQQLVNTELCSNLLNEDKMKYQEYLRDTFPDFSKNSPQYFTPEDFNIEPRLINKSYEVPFNL